MKDRSKAGSPWRYMVCLCILLVAIGMIFFLAGHLRVGQVDEQDVRFGGKDGQEQIYSLTKMDKKTESDDAMEVDLSQADKEYRITEAGAYRLSGEYQGKIVIDVEEQVVHLILDDVNIDSPSGAAVDVESAGKVVITLAEGSDNTIQDSARHRENSSVDAAVYSVCDLTVNGSGSLQICGFYNHGIFSKDVVKLLEGEVSIQSMGDGIRGNDGIMVQAKALDIQSKGYGLRTTNPGKNEKGTIDICGGQITIIAGKYAISSRKNLYVRNCSMWSNAILGDLDVEGERFVEEGCINHE